MIRILSALLFFHINAFGQSEELIAYNESKEKLYECLNLESFEDFKNDFHLRLNIQYSVIVDIYRNEKEVKGMVYNYIFQDEKQLANRELMETNTYIYKIDSLDLEEINSIIHYMDSISYLDSISLPCFSKFNCGSIPPVVNIQTYDSGIFQIRKIHIEHINDLMKNKKLNRKNVNEWPFGSYSGIGGGALAMYYDNPLRIYFSGVSSQFCTRNEQNLNLISNWGSSFEIRDNNTFDFEYLGRKYPENFYTINIKMPR